MIRMRRSDLQDDPAQRWLRQPMWHLMAQHTNAPRYRADILPGFSLACNYQNQPFPGPVSAKDEPDKFRVRFRLGHSVQVDAALGLKLASGHLLMRAPTHSQRLRGQSVIKWRGQIVTLGQRPGGFTDAELLDLDAWIVRFRFGCIGRSRVVWVERRRGCRNALPKLPLIRAQGARSSGHLDITTATGIGKKALDLPKSFIFPVVWVRLSSVLRVTPFVAAQRPGTVAMRRCGS